MNGPQAVTKLPGWGDAWLVMMPWGDVLRKGADGKPGRDGEAMTFADENDAKVQIVKLPPEWRGLANVSKPEPLKQVDLAEMSAGEALAFIGVTTDPQLLNVMADGHRDDAVIEAALQRIEDLKAAAPADPGDRE